MRALYLVAGMALGALLHAALAETPACPERDPIVDALAEVLAQQFVELEDMNDRCVLVPRSEGLGVVKVKRR